MARFVVRFTGVIVFVSLTAALAARPASHQDSGLVVHEWGTFTTVAGEDGSALQWLPLGGQTDLPCFVNHFQDNALFKFAPGGASLTYSQARATVQGTVRMETPVLYFYSPREATVDVTVKFPQGLMTEWYPKAAVTQPPAGPAVLAKPTLSTISWSGVNVRPGTTAALPTQAAASHYYSARDTDAAPLQVAGQDEKFLFYRGVGGFQVPLSGVLTDEGKVRVTSRAAAPLPGVVLFERRGARLGYRIHGDLRSEVTLDPPALTGDVAALKRDLEGMLVASGLYPREAHAMVETWRDSWFEEGVRLFYILPAASVDAVLPLTITPAPARVARAFVGRMEILTPATMCAVRDAIARRDERTLDQYGRFLGPIGDRLLATATPAERARTQSVLAAHYQSMVKQAASACK